MFNMMLYFFKFCFCILDWILRDCCNGMWNIYPNLVGIGAPRLP